MNDPRLYVERLRLKNVYARGSPSSFTVFVRPKSVNPWIENVARVSFYVSNNRKTANITMGSTNANHERSNRHYGTLLRAVGTKYVMNTKVNRLRHEGVHMIKSNRATPPSTRIVRNRLGFKPNHGRNGEYRSVFIRGNSMNRINEIIRQYRALNVRRSARHKQARRTPYSR